MWSFSIPSSVRGGIAESIRFEEKELHNLTIQDKSRVFNTARTEALELQNLIEVALATITSAKS